MVTYASNSGTRKVAMTESLGLTDKHILLLEFQTNVKDLSNNCLLVSLHTYTHICTYTNTHTRRHPQANNTGW